MAYLLGANLEGQGDLGRKEGMEKNMEATITMEAQRKTLKGKWTLGLYR